MKTGSMLDLNTLCGNVRTIAQEAGAFLQAERALFDPSRVEEKSAHNYVSYVDKESERRLVEKLSLLLPEAGFITEEGSAGYQGENYCWVIDPLDGTTNYIHDTAPYCVSIALRDRDETLLGVVYEVCRNECFHAYRGGNAYLDERVIHVSEVQSLGKAFIALGFPYSFHAYKPFALRLIDRLYGVAGGCRLQGSAASELCYVACGRFDARIEAYLGPWDVAAAGLILQQAGGQLSDFHGGEDWVSGKEVIAGNKAIHEIILSLIKEETGENNK